MNHGIRARAQDGLARLGAAKLDITTLIGESSRLLTKVLPYDAACWHTLDPEALIETGAFLENIPTTAEQVAKCAEVAYLTDDYNSFVELTRAKRHSGVLSEATGGTLDRSVRYREMLRPENIRGELRTTFVVDGAAWGCFALFREAPGDFTAAERDFAHELSSLLGLAFRSAGMHAKGTGPALAPGVRMLGRDRSVESFTGPARTWLDELGFRGGPEHDPLPFALLMIAERARATGDEVTARILGESGRWIQVHASPASGEPGRVAVVLHVATSDAVAPLISATYGLTARERELTELVLQGCKTGDRRAPVHLAVHGSGPPQGDLRQDRVAESTRAGGAAARFTGCKSLALVTMNTRDHTARSRVLGAELRAWRLRAKLEGTEVARRLSWSATKVSNLESGRRKVSEVDAAMFLACCRAPGDDIKHVLDFFHEQYECWIQPHGTKLPDELLSLITLETTATRIQTFELAVIPGLLQTEDYARALITSGPTSVHAIDAKVRARKDRQVMLRRLWPPDCLFFIHENALRLPVGSDAIMNDQLLHLVFASARPHVRIRVVPIAAGWVPGMAGGFALMEYDKALPVVFAASNLTSSFLDGPAEVGAHHEILARLARVALDEGQSRDWLAQRANEYDRPREGRDDLVHEEPPLA